MSTLLGQLRLTKGHVIQVRMGDLTKEDVDAIVNPANERLQNGGGAAGAISRAVGPDFQEFCDLYVEENGELEVGAETMIYDVPDGTPVPFRHIISVVGPRLEHNPAFMEHVQEANEFLEPSDEDCDLLYSAVMNTLEDAMERGFETVSIPAISSGIFGFPKAKCAEMLFEAAIRVLQDLEKREAGSPLGPIKELSEIRFTNFDQLTCDIFLAELNRLKATVIHLGDENA